MFVGDRYFMLKVFISRTPQILYKQYGGIEDSFCVEWRPAEHALMMYKIQQHDGDSLWKQIFIDFILWKIILFTELVVEFTELVVEFTELVVELCLLP